ncbi:hypothetical protein X734_22925 [Mesorhizobium sp. L2C084A000]|nr:hypothetical protein X734_22925 [Mesorhizobium sp. L2C084A000]
METSVSAFDAIASGMMYSSCAELVSVKRETGVAVLALGVDFHLSPEMLAEPVELLDGRWSKGERIAFELFQHVLSGNT